MYKRIARIVSDLRDFVLYLDKRKDMPYIVITGAAGFIATRFAKKLNELGMENLILVDDFSDVSKTSNWAGLKCLERIDRSDISGLLNSSLEILAVIHLGARTDTLELDYEVHRKWNVEYSKTIWDFCSQKNIPLIYASSAATYGDGGLGYSDTPELIPNLKPLNPYGQSKNDFDLWAIENPYSPKNWVGLKFFNVYGPGEAHKERMASVVWHGFNQIKETGAIELFKSYNPNFKDGEQVRDFIYVDDVVNVIYWIMVMMISGNWVGIDNGLFNLGTGKPRSFLDLSNALFKSLSMKPNIKFIEMPEKLRPKYQYFTKAEMNKLRGVGYNRKFMTLEEGVDDYVSKYLLNE